MKRISIKFLINYVAPFLLFGGILSLFLINCEVSRPSNWSDAVKLKANIVPGTQRVVDSSTGDPIFSYSVDPSIRRSVDPPIVASSIEKRDNNTWVVVFERVR